MHGLLPAGAVLLAGIAGAAPSRLVVAAGDCGDAALVSAVSRVQRATPGALEPELVLDVVRPPATRGLEEVKRQVDSARTLFYGGQPDRAVELIRQALVELERATPEARLWPVIAEALSLEALFHRSAGRKPESADAMRRVLRVEPTYALDPDHFTPSMVQAFDGVRKEVARARKHALQVQANTAAQVYVDGRLMGQAPLLLELVPGSYRVALVQGESVSFARVVELRRDEVVSVDMALEGAVSARAPVCLAVTDEARQPEAAFKLAAAVNATEVVIVGSRPSRVFHAALWKVSPAGKVREATSSAEQLDDLANFLATGTPASFARPVSAFPKTDASGKVPPEELAKLVPTERPPTAPVEVPALATTRRTSSARWVGFGLLGGGAAMAAAGGVVFALGAPARQRFAELHTADGKLYPSTDPRHREALELMMQVDANAGLSWGLVGVGAGAVVAGVATWLLFPGAPVAVGAAASGQGAAVSLHGRF